MTEKERKNMKLRHELSKQYLEKPLQLDIEKGEDKEFEVSPDQQRVIGKSVRFNENN